MLEDSDDSRCVGGCLCSGSGVIVSIVIIFVFFFFKQKTAYEMCGRDWSSDVCSSDLSDLNCRASRLSDCFRVDPNHSRSLSSGDTGQANCHTAYNQLLESLRPQL